MQVKVIIDMLCCLFGILLLTIGIVGFFGAVLYFKEKDVRSVLDGVTTLMVSLVVLGCAFFVFWFVLSGTATVCFGVFLVDKNI